MMHGQKNIKLNYFVGWIHQLYLVLIINIKVRLTVDIS